MAHRTFTQDGKTYSDAPAGWLKAHKDEWDTKLKAMGHKPAWHKSASNAYSADCRTCGGNMSVGTWGSSSSGGDIRHSRCH